MRAGANYVWTKRLSEELHGAVAGMISWIFRKIFDLRVKITIQLPSKNQYFLLFFFKFQTILILIVIETRTIHVFRGKTMTFEATFTRQYNCALFIELDRALFCVHCIFCKQNNSQYINQSPAIFHTPNICRQYSSTCLFNRSTSSKKKTTQAWTYKSIHTYTYFTRVYRKKEY